MQMDQAQRDRVIEALSEWLRTQIGDVNNDVDFEVHKGVESTFGDDLTNPAIAANGSATLTIHINGGAHHTQGFADDVDEAA